MGFLQEGSKVKATIMFRGREMAHRELGMRMIERLIQEISEVGQVETRPRQEGPNLTAILAPNKKAAGKSPAPKPRPSVESSSAPAPAKLLPRSQTGTAKAAATPETPDSSGG